MYDEDNLQDALSSIGPYRLERVVRRGLYTLSCKVLELPTSKTFLLKIHKKQPSRNANLIAKKDSFYLEKRDWLSRCLKDRLSQFPYMSKSESKLILKYVKEQNDGKVKLSNVLMTHWTRVVFVDSYGRLDDNVACYLDDTTDPLDLAQFKQILGVEELLDDHSFAFVERLALFRDQDCFERAAYITIHQIKEAWLDIIECIDLLEILANCVAQIINASVVVSTRILALELTLELLGLQLPKEFVALTIVPCLMDCLFKSQNQVESMTCVVICSFIHKRIDLIKRVDKIRNLIADNPEVLAVYGSCFSDPSVFEWLVHEKLFALAELVADKLDDKTVSEVCIPRLVACDDQKAKSLMVNLACRVYSSSQIKQLAVPIINEDDLDSWVPLILSGKLDKSTIKKLIQTTKSSKLKSACRSAWDQSDYMLHIESIETKETIDAQKPDESAPIHPQTIMEVDDDKQTDLITTAAPTLGRFDVFSSKVHSTLRFWQPNLLHSLSLKKVLQILQSSRHSIHCFEQTADIFSIVDYPYSIKLVESLTFQGTFLMACVHLNGFVGVVVRGINDDSITFHLYDLQSCATCVSVIALGGCPVHISLLDQSVFCVYERCAEVIDLSTKRRHTLELDFPAMSVGLSLFNSFAVIGSTTGHLVLLDLRCFCVAACHVVVANTPILSVQVTSEWSERAEHRRGRAWIGTASGLLLIDLCSGHIVKDKSLSMNLQFNHVLTTVGAHYVVGITESKLVHYDWRTKKMLQVNIADDQVVVGVALLAFSKCIAIASEENVQFIL